MRLPKFRCKNKVNNWVYFTVLYSGNVDEENFDLETLSEFTGLFDKQGVEIYEGDIVRDTSGYLYQVVWSNKNARFVYKCKLGSKTNMNQKKDIEDGIEIVGNVHENKELFEVNR